MAVRRPPHKTAHSPCPYGVYNWSDCDTAAAHQWGKCKAVVGKTEPEPCVRWAVGEEGYCGQHYVSKVEAEKRQTRIAIAKEELDRRITEYLEYSAAHPSVWDRATKGKEISFRRRKGPHKLTSLA